MPGVGPRKLAFGAGLSLQGRSARRPQTQKLPAGSVLLRLAQGLLRASVVALAARGVGDGPWRRSAPGCASLARVIGLTMVASSANCAPCYQGSCLATISMRQACWTGKSTFMSASRMLWHMHASPPAHTRQGPFQRQRPGDELAKYNFAADSGSSSPRCDVPEAQQTNANRRCGPIAGLRLTSNGQQKDTNSGDYARIDKIPLLEQRIIRPTIMKILCSGDKVDFKSTFLDALFRGAPKTKIDQPRGQGEGGVRGDDFLSAKPTEETSQKQQRARQADVWPRIKISTTCFENY